MSDFDFLKEFGKDLDRERLEMEHSEVDWMEINARLDALDKQKQARRWWAAWWLPMLTGMVFVALGGLLWSAKQEIKSLQTQITAIKTHQVKNSRLALSDTSIQHVQSIQYDTIYETVVIHRTKVVYDHTYWAEGAAFDSTVKNQSEQQKEMKQGEGKNALNEAVVDIESTRLAENAGVMERDEKSNEAKTAKIADNYESKTEASKKQELGGSEIKLTEEEQGAKNETETIQSWEEPNQALAMLPILPLKTVESRHHRHRLDFNEFVMIAEKESKKEALVRHIKPHNFSVGLRSTLILPLTKITGTERSFSYGVSAGLTLGQNLHLIAAIDNGNIDFAVKNNDIVGSGIPLITPPTPDDVLDFVEIRQPISDFSLGLRYDFRTSRRWQPNVYLAWIGEHIHEQTITYEFDNIVTDEESYVKVQQHNAYFNAAGLQAGLGFNWFFVKKMSLGLEAIYQQQVSSVVPLLHERVGARAGLKYYF